MKIYQLTQLGRRLARSTNNPDTANWRVIHLLDGQGYATVDQVALGSGLDENQASGALVLLKRKSLVEER